MRLIDADVLEAEFRRRADTLDKELGGDLFHISEIVMVINNAPIVPLPNFKEGYKQAIIDGKTNFSRPQGKWEFFSIGNNQYSRCSVCKDEHTSEYTDLDWWYDNFKYCPKCGAHMVKETENEQK